jgi:hypothetical protein
MPTETNALIVRLVCYENLEHGFLQRGASVGGEMETAV